MYHIYPHTCIYIYIFTQAHESSIYTHIYHSLRQLIQRTERPNTFPDTLGCHLNMNTNQIYGCDQTCTCEYEYEYYF